VKSKDDSKAKYKAISGHFEWLFWLSLTENGSVKSV